MIICGFEEEIKKNKNSKDDIDIIFLKDVIYIVYMSNLEIENELEFALIGSDELEA